MRLPECPAFRWIKVTKGGTKNKAPRNPFVRRDKFSKGAKIPRVAIDGIAAMMGIRREVSSCFKREQKKIKSAKPPRGYH